MLAMRVLKTVTVRRLPRWALVLWPCGCSLLAPPDSEYLSEAAGSAAGRANAGSGGLPVGGGGGTPSGGSSRGGGASGGGASGGGASAGTGGAEDPGGAGGSPVPDTGDGGQAGSPALPMGPLCAEHPLPPKNKWSATASEYFIGNTEELPSLAIDGTSSRWATGKSQAGNEWLQIDFGATVVLSQVTLVPGADPDFPIHYQLRLSESSNDFGSAPLSEGPGADGAATVITLPQSAVGRYLLISQVGKGNNWWTVAEAYVSCKD